MKYMPKSTTLVAAGGAIGFIILLAASAVTGARPWRAQHPNAIQTTPMTSEMHAQKMPEGMMKGGMGEQMMSGGMACQMMSGEMSCPHNEMKQLAGELVASFDTIRGEQDPAALKSKLAAHEALLKQLQAKSQEECPMMEQMHGPMGGGHQMEHGQSH